MRDKATKALRGFFISVCSAKVLISGNRADEIVSCFEAPLRLREWDRVKRRPDPSVGLNGTLLLNWRDLPLVLCLETRGDKTGRKGSFWWS